MIVTRDDILQAADRIQRDDATGLCSAFRDSGICRFLDATGANTYLCWYWPITPEGREQRLMFLAFMLTWHDEITGHQP
jgi:hypothetical protein